MKYHCETCAGMRIINDACENEGTTGECLTCDGTGMEETCISRIKIGDNLRHRDDLLDLQRDAHQVISDCGKMLVCNPPHWQSYVSQLQRTMLEIETKALKLIS